ncbi:hypothetical protein JL720_8957 [Aureococcus anophagefferens]|nr:hypothetical protein JL720_8957 [Aureococcus anophagefferens]
MVSFGLAGYGLNKKKQQSSSSIYKMLPRTLASAGASARALVRGRSAPSLGAAPGAAAPSPRAPPPPARSSPARRRCACRAPPTRRRRATRPSSGPRRPTTRRRRSAGGQRVAEPAAPVCGPRGRSPPRARQGARRRLRAGDAARGDAAPRRRRRASGPRHKLAKYDEAWIEQKLDENADYGDLARNVECFVSRAVDDARARGQRRGAGRRGAVASGPRLRRAAAARGAARADGGNAYLRRGEVIRQPGDGSCLFHSLAYGLRLQNRHGDARQLRRELMDWLSRNPDASIADTPVGDWVKWDSNCSVDDYTRMRGAGWGGGIEMAAFAPPASASTRPSWFPSHSSPAQSPAAFDVLALPPRPSLHLQLTVIVLDTAHLPQVAK